MRLISVLFLLVAIICASLAIWHYLEADAVIAYQLMVESPDRDLGQVPVGEERPLEFRIHNAGDRPLPLHTLSGELC